MIWQNTWALLGLLTLALPVFIHLLSRKRAVRQKFPSLRFLDATRLLPTRSPHLTDIPLLLVRLAIFALATLALAQPLWLSKSRKESFGSSIARVFIVDTSASMLRGANGATGADSALTAARALASESQASLILQTASPAEAFPGASAWLELQRVRGEVIVLSDFQRGTIDSAAIVRANPAFGVKLVRVAALQAASDSGLVTSRGRVIAVADSSGTRGEWTAGSNAASWENRALQVFASEDTRELASAAQRAALSVWPQNLPDSSRHVAVVFEGAAEHAVLIGEAKAPNMSWMSDAIASVRDNDVLAEAAIDADVRDTTITAPFAVLARNSGGHPVVYAAQSNVSATPSLVFFHRGPVSGLSASALLAAANAATAHALHLGESEPATLDDAALAGLSREPGVAGVNSDESSAERAQAGLSGMSDARWFWLAVLALLLLETLMRRRADVAVAREAA